MRLTDLVIITYNYIYNYIYCLIYVFILYIICNNFRFQSLNPYMIQRDNNLQNNFEFQIYMYDCIPLVLENYFSLDRPSQTVLLGKHFRMNNPDILKSR